MFTYLPYPAPLTRPNINLKNVYPLSSCFAKSPGQSPSHTPEHRFPAPSSKLPDLVTPLRVYDILPSTTAVFSYAIGSRRLSANEQFFVGAHTVVSLFQILNSNKARRVIGGRIAANTWKEFTPTQIIRQSFESRWHSFLTRGGCYVRALALSCFFILVPESFGGRWPRRCGTAVLR